VRRAIRAHLGDFGALLGILALALFVVGYIFIHQAARPRLPFETKPFQIEAAFNEAQAVVPGQGQSVRIAGVQVGLVSGVDIEDGQAVVHMNVDRQYRGYIRTDASALLRPRTGVKDMFVELDPGSASAPAMQDHGRLPVASTSADVNADEVLSTLDADTRAYLQLLVNGAGKGLRGRGDNLRSILARFEPLHRDVARIESAVAARRQDLSTLIHNYGELMSTLGDKGHDLSRLVVAADQVFGAFASQDTQIASAVAQFPPALTQTTSALSRVNTLAHVLRPALDALRPPFRQLDPTNRQLIPAAREGTPILAGQVRPFVRTARPYVRNLQPAAVDLARAAPDLTGGYAELNRLFNMGAYNPHGREPLTGVPTKDSARDEGFLYWLAWVTQDSNSVFSTSDAGGPFRRATLLASCDTWKAFLGDSPSLELIFGLQDALRDPILCKQAR
jgi:phospholipid/cholesterol/gamma-HCH transport system substrate-binding protein